jgi:hypothetical protein
LRSPKTSQELVSIEIIPGSSRYRHSPRNASVHAGCGGFAGGTIYLALGVLPEGTREIFGLWIEGTEGAKFWM